ncbi:hypothetical protein FTUN_2985 [Frigoriglobus tundricola]|uniref:Uncharacterized protein n=1 Tax=Frigoriglobus tundricola TaxID=2774151 RepID=A0A6M5YQ04_9BACT|nr:hypothetical protein FTUN_2985 [Frigoriglobus tundricola]
MRCPTFHRGCRLRPMSARSFRAAGGWSLMRRSTTGALVMVAAALSSSSSAGILVRGRTSLSATVRRSGSAYPASASRHRSDQSIS